MDPVNFFWFGRGTAWALTKQLVGAFLTRRFVRLATAGVWCVAAWEVRAGSPETQEG